MPHQNVIKITFFTYKLPSISTEQFIQRWTAHGIETARILQKHSCLEYTQQHSTPSHIVKLRSIITPSAAKALVSSDVGKDTPYADGVATMIFPDWDSAEAFFKDQENVEQARRDVPGFTDYGRRRMVVGDEIVFLRRHGKEIID